MSVFSVQVLSVLQHSFRGLLGRGTFSNMLFHHEIFRAEASFGKLAGNSSPFFLSQERSGMNTRDGAFHQGTADKYRQHAVAKVSELYLIPVSRTVQLRLETAICSSYTFSVSELSTGMTGFSNTVHTSISCSLVS
ncbi:uncharacterized [Tachysurus ichikawai]